MFVSQSFKYIIVLLTFILSCEEPPTKMELDLLNQLKKEYHGKYNFSVYDATYLKVYAIENIDSTDIIDMSHKIRGKFPNVRWAYINVYDKNNKFLYQIIYDNVNKQYTKSLREYY